MVTTQSIEQLQSLRAQWDAFGYTVGFVPTMGALHAGHISLVDAAKRQCNKVVVSIFVNPTQFNNPEDLAKYPRTTQADLALLQAANCDAVFIPTVEDIYPNGTLSKHYALAPLDQTMEGAFRPGHFQGVATVVHRLFNLVKPNKAFFGEKDFQQLAIIRHFTKELDLGIEIVGCPNLRAPSGLALSSRNMRLTEEQHQIAPEIFQTLKSGLDTRANKSPHQLKIELTTALNALPFCRTEYVEIADETNLQPIMQFDAGTKARLFVAVYIGEIRLIDNLPVI